jgi:hypothetical protein
MILPKKVFIFLFLLFLLNISLGAQNTEEVVHKQYHRRNQRVQIDKTFDAKTGKKLSKKKTRDGKLIYEVHFDKRGKIYKSTNRKGLTKMHKRGCNC